MYAFFQRTYETVCVDFEPADTLLMCRARPLIWIQHAALISCSRGVPARNMLGTLANRLTSAYLSWTMMSPWRCTSIEGGGVPET